MLLINIHNVCIIISLPPQFCIFLLAIAEARIFIGFFNGGLIFIL